MKEVNLKPHYERALQQADGTTSGEEELDLPMPVVKAMQAQLDQARPPQATTPS